MEKPLDVHSLIARAVAAPSGDNAQPWRFKLGHNSVMLHNAEGADPTLYNFRERGSYLSHGAVAENLRLLAAQCGYGCRIEPFPGEPNVIARITFTTERTEPDPLASAIAGRSTNRKPYAKKPLDPAHRRALEDAAAAILGVRFIITERREDVAALAASISLNERLLMEHRELHDFLFSMIRWSREEERHSSGLYVKTMEFPPPLRLLLKHALVHWGVVQRLNRIGFSRAIGAQTRGLYESSSAIGAFTIASEEPADFFNAGRAFQRLWLAATSAGISIQPLAALAYLAQRLREGEAGMFSEEQQQSIAASNRAITTTLGVPEETCIAMLFRAGYGKPPTARSEKLPPAFLQ